MFCWCMEARVAAEQREGGISDLRLLHGCTGVLHPFQEHGPSTNTSYHHTHSKNLAHHFSVVLGSLTSAWRSWRCGVSREQSQLCKNGVNKKIYSVGEWRRGWQRSSEKEESVT